VNTIISRSTSSASITLADDLRGKDVLLLAGSNAEAAELSRRVQARLARMGAVGRPQATLGNGNQAGVGDLVRSVRSFGPKCPPWQASPQRVDDASTAPA
jgi:hypothetical protein